MKDEDEIYVTKDENYVMKDENYFMKNEDENYMLCRMNIML